MILFFTLFYTIHRIIIITIDTEIVHLEHNTCVTIPYVLVFLILVHTIV